MNLTRNHLNRNDSKPLHRQIYDIFRQEILNGGLRPGTKLPATRTLAKELGIARNTVDSAYRQLNFEGYLETKVGAGTRVTLQLPEQILKVNTGSHHQNQQPDQKNVALRKPRLSERGKAIVQIPYDWEKKKPIPFTSTLPGVDAFPFKLWEKLLVASWRGLSSHQLGYQSAMGHRPLREAIATYLRTARGVRCSADQVIITNGTQQALTTTAHLLLNKGDAVWVENPSYAGIRSALHGALADIIPVRVDEEGLTVADGLAKAPKARLAFISPSHQYPLGVTMGLKRRLELLQWAEEVGAWVIEDDYDSEYRYNGYPLEALQSLDNSGRVIYVGTLSKVLFPALRMGYMVVPQNLVEPFHATRAFTDRGNSLLEQVALTTFMNEGHFERHVRQMRTLYAKRQKVLVEAAKTHLAGLLDVPPKDAGLHLVGWLPTGTDDRYISEQLREHGIDTPALSSFSMTPLVRRGLVMGYAAVTEPEIVVAVKKMKPILERLL